MFQSRKFISLLCVICMLSALSAPAFAASEPSPPNLEEYAYMDLDSSPFALQLVILAARRHLIYGAQAWSVNEGISIVRTDGTVYAVPKFEDVYPGWDLNQICTLDKNLANAALTSFGLEEFVLSDAPAATVSASQSRSRSYATTLTLPAAVSGQDAPIFYRFNSNGESVEAYAQTLPNGCESYNIGYNNEDTGVSIDWIPYLKLGDELNHITQKSTESGVRYGVRISTYSVTGAARVAVDLI